MVTLGSILQLKWKFLTLKKAGSNRILGRRPHVRGYAKNPWIIRMGVEQNLVAVYTLR